MDARISGKVRDLNARQVATRSASAGQDQTKATKVEGEGTAELLDDGTIEIEFAYDNGDEAVLKAKRMASSTTC